MTDSLQSEYEALKADQATLLEETASLRNELASSKLEIGTLKSQLVKVSFDHENSQSQLESVTREKDHLYQTAQQSSHYSQSNLAELEAAASRWEQKFREIESQRKRLEDQVCITTCEQFTLIYTCCCHCCCCCHCYCYCYCFCCGCYNNLRFICLKYLVLFALVTSDGEGNVGNDLESFKRTYGNGSQA